MKYPIYPIYQIYTTSDNNVLGSYPINLLKHYIIAGTLFSGMIICVYISEMPNVQMKITQIGKTSLDILVRTHNYSQITKITNKNVEYLTQKGYLMSNHIKNKKYYDNIYWGWAKTLTLKKLDNNFHTTQFIDDCKKNDIHTEIIYTYDTWLGNEKQKKKKLYWHKCYRENLK